MGEICKITFEKNFLSKYLSFLNYDLNMCDIDLLNYFLIYKSDYISEISAFMNSSSLNLVDLDLLTTINIHY